MSATKAINSLLVNLYQDVLDAEECALIKGEFIDISLNDMHVIEAIALQQSTSSEVASRLGITMGSLTRAIDGLVKKGYVLRERSENDKRVVLLSLLEKGKRAFAQHSRFHAEMVKSVVGQLDSDETKLLESTLSRLEKYLHKMSGV